MLWARTPKENIPALDGLRAISVALVIFDHLCLSGALPFHQTAIDFGNLGVRVFFVISGFLITTLLLRDEERTGVISLRGFYIRRVFRIVPIFLTYFAGVMVLRAAAHKTPSLGDILAALTFNIDYFRPVTFDFDHLWSLGVEEKFYLIWPLALVWSKSLRGRSAAWWIAMGSVAVVPLLRSRAALDGASYDWLLWPFHHTCDAIAAGCLLAMKRHGAPDWARWRDRGGAQAFLAAAFCLVIAASYKLGLGFWLFGITAMNICIAVAIDVLVSQPASRMTRILNSAPFAAVGTLSYGLYLFQQPLLVRTNLGPLSRFPLDVIVLGAIVVCAYYLIEQPARAWGRRFALSR